MPRIVHPRHVGKTPLGPRGDAVVAFDEQVGRILDALEQAGVAEHTLVILTSDNGPVLDDGYKDGAVELNRAAGHLPAGPFRGGKYSAYQGGTRVPFVVRWPGVVRPGTVSDILASQVDLPATLARIAGADPSPFLALDSVVIGLSPSLVGGRDHIVSQGIEDRFSLREGKWSYVTPAPARDFADFHGPGYRPGLPTYVPQLYDLEQDPGETLNLADRFPEEAARLRARLALLRARGENQPLPP